MEVGKHEMPGDVACLDITPVPEGRQRSRFLVVGSYDNTIRILSLDPDDCRQILSVQSVSSPPESLLLLASTGGEEGAEHPASVFLNAGLQNGVLFRTVVDSVTGQLSETQPQFLGLRAPKLFSATVRGRQAMLCLILDPKTGNTTCLLELQDNEAAFSICTVNFHDKEYGTLLAVGVAKELQFWPKRSVAAGFIHIYRFTEEGESLELVHKTQEGVPVPLALCQFQGRLLAGIGSVLRLYDLGKRRLLRKCENTLFPHSIVSIHTYRDRIYVGDIQDAMQMGWTPVFGHCEFSFEYNGAIFLQAMDLAMPM
ncbi:hypothetical protein ZIOFF_027748 [Zingiber officinale]|uniref:Uncharacterized protein n=1 Tax=Zingiber officinale TaxID=94328 RepID=A0A8J5LEC3_ZINOF|nr:hypothetical protein ZIOFF_027748 [Zingiber officinale]